jgi:hypothetical protein
MSNLFEKGPSGPFLENGPLPKGLPSGLDIGPPCGVGWEGISRPLGGSTSLLAILNPCLLGLLFMGLGELENCFSGSWLRLGAPNMLGLFWGQIGFGGKFTWRKEFCCSF